MRRLLFRVDIGDCSWNTKRNDLQHEKGSRTNQDVYRLPAKAAGSGDATFEGKRRHYSCFILEQPISRERMLYLSYGNMCGRCPEEWTIAKGAS
jgi:hypothetical protein